MPARKPSGAATSAAMSTIGSVRRIGCQPAPQRMRTTIPSPIQPKRTTIHAPRRRPALYSSRQPPVGLGAWWTSWAVAAVVVTCCSFLPAHPFLIAYLFTRLLGRLHEERHERV